MKHSVLATVGLGLLSSVSWAQASPTQLIGRSAECIVDRGIGAFDISSNPAVITALSFPGILEDGAIHGSPRGAFSIRRHEDALYIRPRGPRLDATANLVVTVADPPMRVNLFVHVTENPGEALEACRFVSRDMVDAEQQRIEAAADQKAAEKTAGLWAKMEETQRKRDQAQTLAMIKDRLLGDSELMPRVREMRGTSGQVAVQLGRAIYHQGDLWTTFFIENAEWQPLRLANVQVVNKDGTILPLQDVVLEPPAVPHAEALGEVPVGHRVAGLMRLPGLAEGVEPLEITFTGFTGARMFAVTAEEPIWVWVPRREDQVREEMRQEAALRAARGMVTLSLKGIYGAIWLGDGAGLERSDATSAKGLGLRVTYGISPMWAVEGEVMGASTGNAQFGDVTYDGVQGDLARSASLGRVQFGALLRLSEGRYIPILRLGVGSQGASHNGSLTTATGETPGPEAFEWTFLFSFGAGIDVRFGPFRAGVALSGLTPFGDYDLSRRSIEAGIHLGYAWKP